MAGPDDPPPVLPDPNNVEAVGDAAKQSAAALGNLSDIAFETQGSFDGLNSIVGKSSSMFSTLNQMIQ